MKRFSKKKEDEFFIADEGIEAFTFGDAKNKTNQPTPNVLTPEEIFGNGKADFSVTDSGSALRELQRKISSVAEHSEFNFQNADTRENKKKQSDPAPGNTAEPIKQMLSALEAESKAEPTEQPKQRSLFDKCRPFIVDDEGNGTVNTEPLYKLQSVAEILKNDSEKALERLSERYEIEFDDLGRTGQNKKTNSATEPTPRVKTAANRKKSIPDNRLFEDELPVKNQVKNIQSSVASVISDIDAPEAADCGSSATITFTPLSGTGALSHIAVSSNTRTMDLTGELAHIPEKTVTAVEERVRLEKSEFEEFVPDEELTDESDLPRFIREYSIKKRRGFLQVVLSFIFTAILAIAELPWLSGIISENHRTVMIACTAVTAVTVLINFDIFSSFGKIFKKNCCTDIFAAMASLFTLLYAVFGIIKENLTVNILLLLSVILFFRALGVFWNYSRMLSNLKIISGGVTKRAVRLISDSAVTFAMAKNAVEGEVLIAAPQRADNIEDYVKYSVYGNVFGGRAPLITAISLALSAAVGIACATYFDGAVYGLYAAAAVQCFTALPALFLIEKLPNYSASKRLNPKGAMIAGKAGAEHIEEVNAAVFGATDFFPSGTVTLHQMQVLSQNDLQDTIVRAASLTESLDSPLTSIFKKIAGTGNITAFPDSDTVKYEERMGISGWVDNRLLFIGNRTLMEAHGIEVPSVEVDRAILKQGYFPVYVATRDKACALLVVQYSVDKTVASELRRLTGLGVTLLVNSSDPNLTEEMLCDYFGLYEDCVKVMSAAGCHMYRNTVTHKRAASAPAAYRANQIALASIINCASKIRRSNILLTAAYIICAAVGILFFTFASLGGSGTLLSEGTLLLYGIISTAATYLVYLIERP